MSSYADVPPLILQPHNIAENLSSKLICGITLFILYAFAESMVSLTNDFALTILN